MGPTLLANETLLSLSQVEGLEECLNATLDFEIVNFFGVKNQMSTLDFIDVNLSYFELVQYDAFLRCVGVLEGNPRWVSIWYNFIQIISESLDGLWF